MQAKSLIGIGRIGAEDSVNVAVIDLDRGVHKGRGGERLDRTGESDADRAVVARPLDARGAPYVLIPFEAERRARVIVCPIGKRAIGAPSGNCEREIKRFGNAHADP
jgi:hypothetical protein